jgi:cytoskeletal protein RodZ
MADIELFPDEEEEMAAEESANRTFVILVAALGGLLALSVCAFVIWALVGNRWMQERIQAQNHSIEVTNTAVAAAAADTATAAVLPTATGTPAPTVPTDTPQPTSTKPPTAVPATVTPPSGTATEEPAATLNPTPTRRPTATPRSGGEKVPGTGISALGASVLALGLLFLLVVVRRVRQAV